MFPAQLRQAVLSIQHLFSLGFEPENIQLVGDSAGGALIHQVLSHILHPAEGVPKLTLTSPLEGAYMMSPWTRLVDGHGSLLHTNDGRGDVLAALISTYLGSKVLAGAKPSPLSGGCERAQRLATRGRQMRAACVDFCGRTRIPSR